ncbi:MAG TPA: diacylglycerol kinase family protein [Bacteroidia bacterium]|nr:diacylglycerol kinase family protein [Bacteroidia bacterium]
MATTSNFSLKSFVYAFNGLKEAAGTQPNFKIHIVAAILAVGGGLFFKITAIEWAIVFFAIGLVTAAECFNTALEYLTDLVSPQHNVMAGKVKDLSAAGVLICSFTAAAIGLIIFIPKIWSWV